MGDDQPGNARISRRPIANPMALGFLGVVVASLVDAGIALGWYPLSQYHDAALVILVFAPVTGLIACVFGFLAPDPIASTGFGVQAVGWASIGLLLLLGTPGRPEPVLGTLLFGAAAALSLISVTSLKSKLLPALVLGLTATRWGLEGLYETTGGTSWQDISGVVGLALCTAALFAAAEAEIRSQP